VKTVLKSAKNVHFFKNIIVFVQEAGIYNPAANIPQKVQKHTAAALRRRNELRKLELRTLAAERNFRRRLEER
jgi:aspartyl-tRNA synthetase